MSTVDLERLPRLGGVLCLDFVNTLVPRYGPIRDYLPDYGTLVQWAVSAGTVERERADSLVRAALSRPSKADAVLRRTHALRDALHFLFAPATRSHPEGEALELFNDELREATRHAMIVVDEGGYEAGWAASDAFDQVLWPVVRSAAELLTSPALGRVRECEGRNCGWLFLDTSKAGRRRWCSMANCGNREKAERHRRRKGARPRAPSVPARGNTAPS